MHASNFWVNLSHAWFTNYVLSSNAPVNLKIIRKYNTKPCTVCQPGYAGLIRLGCMSAIRYEHLTVYLQLSSSAVF